MNPFHICLALITVLTIAVPVFLLLWLRARRQVTALESQMKKLKYELSIKSINMLEKIEKLTEENTILKEKAAEKKTAPPQRSG